MTNLAKMLWTRSWYELCSTHTLPGKLRKLCNLKCSVYQRQIPGRKTAEQTAGRKLQNMPEQEQGTEKSTRRPSAYNDHLEQNDKSQSSRTSWRQAEWELPIELRLLLRKVLLNSRKGEPCYACQNMSLTIAICTLPSFIRYSCDDSEPGNLKAGTESSLPRLHEKCVVVVCPGWEQSKCNCHLDRHLLLLSWASYNWNLMIKLQVSPHCIVRTFIKEKLGNVSKSR